MSILNKVRQHFSELAQGEHTEVVNQGNGFGEMISVRGASYATIAGGIIAGLLALTDMSMDVKYIMTNMPDTAEKALPLVIAVGAGLGSVLIESLIHSRMNALPIATDEQVVTAEPYVEDNLEGDMFSGGEL
jgi:energy-converting hydrogenase Eha subunit G